MSSPTRVPLSPKKRSDLNSATPSPEKSAPNSPFSRNNNPFQSLPAKLSKLTVNLTPQKKKPSLGFTIYEDTPEEQQRYHGSRASNASKESFDDKENILQPKKLPIKQQSYTRRTPLGELNMDEFAGYLHGRGSLTRGPIKLTDKYYPSTQNNERNSLHKFNRLPSYITPPRNALNKILYRTNRDDDEIERKLVAKLIDVARRKRLMSVGVNKGKSHLITKNKFKIVSS